MIEVGEASSRILKEIRPLPAETVDIDRAGRRVLAERVVAASTSPPWDNSSMDGFAVRSADVVLGGKAAHVLTATAGSTAAPTLKVVATIAAGSIAARPLGAGEAMRIMTGAPVPIGADSVVRIEDTDRGTDRVTILDLRDLRKNVRRAGEDFKTGDVLFEPGASLSAAHIGVLASAGVRAVSVHRRPRVAIISSGDELIDICNYEPGIAPTKIVSSNSLTLAELIRGAGGEPVDLGIAADRPDAIREKFESAGDCDLIITTAGVSVGDLDHVRPVFASLGGELRFWKVRMRPGAPLAFGILNEIPWLGFSGNPVSAMVSFEVFARPVIRKMLGASPLFRRLIDVTLTEPVEIAASLTHFLRVVVTREKDGHFVARPAGSQSSAVLTAMARATALLIVPADCRSNPAGTVLRALPLTDDLQLSDELGIQ